MATGPNKMAPSTASAIPRTLGFVHLGYGLVMILCGLGWGAYLLGIPMLMERGQAKAKQQAERVTHRRVVVNDIYSVIAGVHRVSLWRYGRRAA